MLHHSADDHVSVLVTERINVELGGAVEVLVNKDRGLVADLDGKGQIPKIEARVNVVDTVAQRG
jgi:hypothetical protein